MTIESAHPSLSPDFRTHVYAALRQWYADPSEGSAIDYLDLVAFELNNGATNIRVAANRVLNNGLAELASISDASEQILRLRFLDNHSTYIVANRLNISEPTVFRHQSRAIDQLADVLATMEGRARNQRNASQEARLEPATYLRLLGVDARRDQLLDLLLDDAPPWIVALNGIGGIGKTSLADATARTVIRRRLDGEVAWVSARQQRFDLGGVLRQVDRPALTVAGLLEALTMQLLPGAPPFTSSEKTVSMLRAAFAQRPTLFVVDNLETAADVESLLPVLHQLAGPAKILLTSRHSLFGQAGVFHLPVPELGAPEALSLVRLEAEQRNLPELAAASDAELQPIYQTVGGNPLALRLVVGQSHVHSLATVLGNLQGAQGTAVETLYTFIYRWAWDNLRETPRRALLAMPLVTERGASAAYLAQLSGLEAGELSDALAELVTLSLVDSRGSALDRRYTIHNLTRTFLLKQVIRWQ